MSTPKPDSRRRWPWWIMLLAVIGAAIAVTAIPVFVIMPFKAQTSAGVAWSYWLRRLSPIVTVVALLLSFGLIYRLWSGARWYGRAAMFLLLAPLGLVVWFARQNHFEWLFNPLPNAAYAPAAETTFVPETDMVLGVELNGEAVAYPVRQMAYHHVVNDVVGGKPITATY